MESEEEQSVYKHVGLQIRLAREQSQPPMSQAKLADRIDLTRTSVVNIEKGRQKTPLHILWRIATVLGIEPRNLIPLSEELHAPSTPLHLDAEAVHQIEAAANDDPLTRTLLERFIKRAKSRSNNNEPS